MATLRNAFTESVRKDLYKAFFESYDQKPTIYNQIYQEVPSDAAWEQGTSIVGVGQLAEKAEGDPITYRRISEGYTTYGINKTFSDGFELSMEAVEDNKKVMNLVQTTASGWGVTVKNTLEAFYASPFNNGGLTAGHDTFKNVISGIINQNAGGLLYDGKPLFNLSNNTRASVNGGTYYNGLALGLTKANLETAWLLMTSTNNRDEKDEIVSIQPTILLIPPALKFTADVILNSTLLPGSTNNDVNTMASIVKPLVWDYLTDTDAWFLVAGKMGLIAQKRKDPVIDFYQDEDTKSFKANIIMRYGKRFDNWRGLVGSNFATS